MPVKGMQIEGKDLDYVKRRIKEDLERARRWTVYLHVGTNQKGQTQIEVFRKNQQKIVNILIDETSVQVVAMNDYRTPEVREIIDLVESTLSELARHGFIKGKVEIQARNYFS